jgi:hypothetical protein
MSDRVKVLVVIGQLEVGGTEMHLLNVLPDVNQSPLEIIVYALRGGGRLHGAFERAGLARPLAHGVAFSHNVAS